MATVRAVTAAVSLRVLLVRPPWDDNHPARLERGSRLEADHRARVLDAVVDRPREREEIGGWIGKGYHTAYTRPRSGKAPYSPGRNRGASSGLILVSCNKTTHCRLTSSDPTGDNTAL